MKIAVTYQFWMGRLALALGLLVLLAPLLHLLNAAAQARLTTLAAKITATQLSLKQLDEDIQVSQTIHSAKDRAELESVLAPVDRLQITSLLEQQASADRIGNFSFTLAPEQPKAVDSPSGTLSLYFSTLELAGDVALDGDIYLYLQHIKTALPGQLTLTHLTLERLTKDTTPPAAVNLHFTAQFDWLSNGTEKHLAGR